MSDYPKNYCAYPFVQVSINPVGKWKLCCVDDDGDDQPTDRITDFPGGKNFSSQDYNLDDFWNSEYLNFIRSQMLENKPVHECRSCRYYEKKGVESYRQRANKKWGYHDKPTDTPIYVDLKLGNTCNLQCVFCDPNSSSKILQEWKSNGWLTQENAPFDQGIMGPILGLDNSKPDYQWVNKNDFWDNIEEISPNLSLMKFTGGEPMLNKKMYKLLENLIKGGYSKDIDLQFTTNGTVFDSRILNILNNFRKVEVNFSCDGLKGVNSYIRYPIDHNQWINNINSFAQHCSASVSLNIQHSYGALTLLDDAEYFEWVFQQKKFGWHTFKVFRPDFMQIEVLDRITLDLAAESLQKTIDLLIPQCENERDMHLVKDIQGICEAVKTATDMTYLRPKLKSYVEKLDKSRNINIYDYIPKLKGHL